MQQIKWDIDNVASYEPDGMNLVIRTEYNSKTGEFGTSQSLERLWETYEYAKSLGIPTVMVRVSASRYNQLYLNAEIMAKWQKFYYELLVKVVEMFKYEDIPYFCIMNETDSCNGDSKYDIFTLQCIEVARDAGFQVGISCAGTRDAYEMTENVRNSLDFIGINIYPRTGYKGNYTDYSEWITVMQTYKNNIENMMAELGKPVFITEVGIADSWECQTEISYYNKGTLSYGVLPATFWIAYFETGLGENCLGTSMWFWESSKNYQVVKDIIKQYTS